MQRRLARSANVDPTMRAPFRLCFALPACLAAAAGAQDPSPGYRAALDAALQRCQSELERGVAVTEDHSTWETAWEVSSEHYTVRTTHSHWLAARIATGLDTMLGHFRSVLRPDFTPGERFVVHVLPDVESYNTFGNANGEHHSSMYGSFYANGHPQKVVAAVYDPNVTWLQMWITHSAYHQFAERAFPGSTPATWIDEGLASYFALYWAPDYGIDEHLRLAGGDGFVSLTRLMTGGITGYADHTHDRFMELGMLFTWLLHYRDDTRMPAAVEERVDSPGAFAGYLRAVLRGDEPDPAMVALVQDRSALQDAFRAFTFGR